MRSPCPCWISCRALNLRPQCSDHLANRQGYSQTATVKPILRVSTWITSLISAKLAVSILVDPKLKATLWPDKNNRKVFGPAWVGALGCREGGWEKLELFLMWASIICNCLPPILIVEKNIVPRQQRGARIQNWVWFQAWFLSQRKESSVKASESEDCRSSVSSLASFPALVLLTSILAT